MSLPQLARACGMSPSALRNWTKKADRPLCGSPTHPAGPVLYTWAHLRAFCAEHPELPGVRSVTARIAGTPPAGVRGPRLAGGAGDPEQVRVILGDLRAAAEYTITAVLSAARSAEQTATAHREQVEALVATIRSYDDLLTQLATPITPHD